MANQGEPQAIVVICEHTFPAGQSVDFHNKQFRCIRKKNLNYGNCGVPSGLDEVESGINCCSVAFQGSVETFKKRGAIQSNRFNVFSGITADNVVINNGGDQFVRTTSGRIITNLPEKDNFPKLGKNPKGLN